MSCPQVLSGPAPPPPAAPVLHSMGMGATLQLFTAACVNLNPTSFSSPSSPAQQDPVQPDDWESSHNHSPGSGSWLAAAKWMKQAVDIVCCPLRTGVSQSRDQDKVGVELLSYQTMRLIMSPKHRYIIVFDIVSDRLQACDSCWSKSIYNFWGMSVVFWSEIQGKFVVTIHKVQMFEMCQYGCMRSGSCCLWRSQTMFTWTQPHRLLRGH